MENVNVKMKGLAKCMYSTRGSFIGIKNDIVEEYLLNIGKLSSYIVKWKV